MIYNCTLVRQCHILFDHTCVPCVRLVLKKDDLDDAFRDKKFPENSKVEMLFEKNNGKKGHVKSELSQSTGAVQYFVSRTLYIGMAMV